MPCDTQLQSGQTISQRAVEVRESVNKLSSAVASGKVKVKVGPQGAIAFLDWDPQERSGVTDACAYRRLLVSGSSLAKAKIAQAEQIAGRSVDKRVIGQGAHSHDGGNTWHDHKG